MMQLKPVHESSPVSEIVVAQSRYSASRKQPWHEAKPGVFTKLLFENPVRHERTLLVRLDPGAKSPAHSHEEFEQIYVIEGTFEDGERLLAPGDFCCRSPGQVHTAWSPDGALVLVTYYASKG